LVKLSRAIDWGFLEQTFGAVYTENPGQPPLPARLMAGLAILKHTYDLSDEAALCDRWVEPYFQYICGEAFFQHALVFDRCLLTRWRQRMGQEKLKALLRESLAVATRTDAMKPSDLACVVIAAAIPGPARAGITGLNFNLVKWINPLIHRGGRPGQQPQQFRCWT
jgi:IS5 family transposase